MKKAKYWVLRGSSWCDNELYLNTPDYRSTAPSRGYSHALGPRFVRNTDNNNNNNNNNNPIQARVSSLQSPAQGEHQCVSNPS